MSKCDEGGADGDVSTSDRKYRIGCALLPKKESRYLTSHILELARKSGVEMCVVDPARPLSEQGYFDVIIHKRQMDRAWEQNLEDYCRENPRLKVIDNVDGIRMLADRCTMLSIIDTDGMELHRPKKSRRNSGSCEEMAVQGAAPADRLESPPRSRGDSPPRLERVSSVWANTTKVTVLAPPQVLISEGSTLEQVELDLKEASVCYPLVAKSQWADGREGSHLLAVVHDRPALQKLLDDGNDVNPPFVVQEYVEHGGVLYKIYVVGSRTMCSQRPSLSLSKGKHSGLELLPRISCQRRSSENDVQQPKRVPPEWITHSLANALRKRLGLQLFNFDMIEAKGAEGVFYVLDINYFPGVDKIRDFEKIFVDFLLGACREDS
ncbi:hypothetical protein BSKO_13312 [Bryopsis sp. KO-2023]|nr:hypothetical protein BSKO_13312 [Bryopsis sp. KO-2023]